MYYTLIVFQSTEQISSRFHAHPSPLPCLSSRIRISRTRYSNTGRRRQTTTATPLSGSPTSVHKTTAMPAVRDVDFAPPLNATTALAVSQATESQTTDSARTLSTPNADPLQMSSEALAAVLVGVVGITVTVILAYWHTCSSRRGQKPPRRKPAVREGPVTYLIILGGVAHMRSDGSGRNKINETSAM